MSLNTWARLAGRCRNGMERDGGKLLHLVDDGDLPHFGKAICGAKPGKRSNGWHTPLNEGQNKCTRCEKRNAILYTDWKMTQGYELDDGCFVVEERTRPGLTQYRLVKCTAEKDLYFGGLLNPEDPDFGPYTTYSTWNDLGNVLTELLSYLDRKANERLRSATNG